MSKRLLVTLAAAGTLAALLLRLLGQSPLEALQAGLSPLTSAHGLATALNKACPLILVGLGTIVAFRAKVYNIGGEGQMVVGALAATAAALAGAGLPGVVLIPLTLLAGSLAGALWGGLAGALKAYLGVNEVLSTVMLNQIALQLSIFLLRGPLLDPQQIAAGTRIPQSADLPPQAWLWRAGPHLGVLLAVALAVVAYVVLKRSVLGFHLRVVGQSREAARYAGLSVPRTILGAMAVSGALAGLAGTLEVVGLQHRCVEGISGGYGFSGIVAALLASLHPLGLLASSFFFGALLVGADEIQRTLQVPAALAIVIQGLVVLLSMAKVGGRGGGAAPATRVPAPRPQVEKK